MYILKSRRFLPLFVTQFLGAFNDNLFKNALVMLVVFRYAAHSPIDPQILVTLAAGIFIFPFLLFSATAGQLADKMDRALLARYVKLAEIGFMVLAALGFLLPNIWLLLTVLFCMGTHSAFFGPVKYAILPQHLAADEILSGNGWVEAGTFLAILLGTIFGGLLVMHPEGPVLIAGATVLVAVAGYVSSRSIPAAPGPSPELAVNPNVFRETLHTLGQIRAEPEVCRVMVAISWFWFVGAVYLAQFPAFGKVFLSGDESVVTLMLTLFSIGIGAGSLLCNRLLKGRVAATYVPAAALAMAAFGIDLYFATRGGSGLPASAVQTAFDFMATGAGWRVMFDLFMIALAGGVFVVPLYAMVQKHADPQYLARRIAGLNVMNALFMVASSLVTVFLFALSLRIPEVFLIVAVLNILAAVYTRPLRRIL